MTYNFIKTQVQGHVYYLTLARESKRNAFTPTMVNEIAHAIEEVNQLDGISLLVLQAEGPVFCAGMDLQTYQDPSADSINPNLIQQELSLGMVMERLERPSLAILQGNVIAGGFLFLLGCTYVFAEKDVEFRLPEVDLGIFPFQVLSGLCRIMPEKKALQLCLDSNAFGTDKALELGLVDGLFEKNKVADLIASFSERNTPMLKAAMKAIKTIRNMDTDDQYSYLLQSLNDLKTVPEVRERLTKALKKR